ncbi:MAG: trehalase [Acidobacteria bacterium]|nr:trehalase [Acidobacteriota bacterium]MBS1864801.1 trehalase [Acidobacteriota bacterium]
MQKWVKKAGCKRSLVCLAGSLLLATIAYGGQAESSKKPAEKDALTPIREYIFKSWDTLTRSMEDCSTVVDSKLAENSVLYLPADFDVPASVVELQKRCHVQVKKLPKKITGPGQIDTTALSPQGLLYLEHKYVVPGGRFNEMYGWDSYFIVRGLLQDGKVELAKSMVENFFFEIEHYGSILNANRSYYLSRSQPPFLTSMISGVYEAEKAAGREDKKWLERAYDYAKRDHAMWVREPHLAADTGLSRYYDFGDVPAPESLKDETDHYRKVAAYFLNHPEQDHGYLVRKQANSSEPGVGKTYVVQICDAGQATGNAGCDSAEEITLSKDFYRGDRSMRESGFDVSFRFGPHGAATHHFAPVCLNSLLYKAEKDLEAMAKMLGKPGEAADWAKQADIRKQNIQKYLWDEQHGFYFDYNLDKKERSTYIYITAYYPLWAGLATPEQAAALVKNISKLEQPGGLVMSPYETEGQWDFPYAWAPTQMIAVEGLRKYGFNKDADRISFNFAAMIAENFRRDGTIREKYNAVTRSSETAVKAGYNINVVGFGWTNAAFVVFLSELPKELREKLAHEQTIASVN